jgi:tetratricopeptide (TPR) repeat protein
MTMTDRTQRESDRGHGTASAVRRGSGVGRAACFALLLVAIWEGPSVAMEEAASPSVGSPAANAAAPTSKVPPAGSAVPRNEPGPGQLSTKFAIDYWDPEKSVPTAKDRDNNPLEFGYFLQDLLEKAERARKDNDFQALIRFYRAVAKAVPDNAKGWSKLCEAYEFVKDRDRAIRACKYAIERPAVEVQDYVRYVNLVLSKDGALSPAEIADLKAVFEHLEKQGPSTAFLANSLRCQTAVRVKDVEALEACTKEMSRLAPDDAKTVVFQWSLALEKGQRAEAERLIDRAVKAGVLLENIQRMQKVTSSIGSRGQTIAKVAVVVCALALALAAALAIRRRGMTRGMTQRLAR